MSIRKPVSTTGGSVPSAKQRQGAEALELMQRALDLIDEAEGPDDAGARLDEAINRLKEWIKNSEHRS